MRATGLIILVSALLLGAPAALAAPTCDDFNGDTIRCGTPGAMPVGWRPPMEKVLDREALRPPDLNPDEFAALICLLSAVFAMLALMPEFDGWTPGDWDEQEGDREERRAP